MKLKEIYSFFTNDNCYNLFLLVAIVLFSITAFNSHGFYQGDAHYQVIEFANLKLGVNGIEDMPWEYQEQIRPSLQPIIAYSFLKVFYFFHILNPYDIAFLFRLLSAGVYLLVIHYFIKQTRGDFGSKGILKYYYLASFFLYFIPYLSLQFSSENWSGIFFTLGLAYYFNPKQIKYKSFFLGLILGVAFLFRYQIAIAILVFFIWILLIKKESYKLLFEILIGATVAFVLGVVLDCWFYNEFVLTSWNYFYQNLVLDKASEFGIRPWDFYYHQIVNQTLYKLGFPIILACVFALIIKSKNLFVWIFFSYIICHSLIPHKELRFLFSVVSLIPILLAYTIEWWFKVFKNQKWLLRSIKMLVTFYFTVHVVLALGYSQYNENGIVNGTTKFIYETYPEKEIQLNYYGGFYSAEFCEEDYLPMKFYFDENISFNKIESLDSIKTDLKKRKEVNLFLIDALSLNDETKVKLACLNYKVVKKGKPKWLEKINRYKNQGETTNSVLFQLVDP